MRESLFEKPFGHDLASAQQLNAALHAMLPESRIFRIDHYFAKEIAGQRWRRRAADLYADSSQWALIISHEFLNTLGCEVVCDVKALPGKIQIQLFVWGRLQKLATRIKPFVPEVLIWLESR